MKLIRRFSIFSSCVAVAAVAVCAGRLSASVIYVDNQRGNDAYNGASRQAVGPRTGPTRTIRRALELVRRGDAISIRNTGQPYHESIALSGSRHSGVEGAPFSIISDGAVIDGTKPVPDVAWQDVGRGVWRIKPWRKGYYQLLMNEKPVPGKVTPRSAKELPPIAAGEWTAWKGSIYYRAAANDSPLGKPLRFAYGRVGLSMYNVRDVLIRGLTIRGFQIDGVNAHDLCERVALENVNIAANARAGVAVGGSSAVSLKNCTVSGNRLHSALVTELGGLKLEDSKLSRPPTLPKR